MGQIIVDLDSIAIQDEEVKILTHPQTAGVLLFKRNYRDLDTLKQLVKDIRDCSNKQLLICVDHEGGRIWRFEDGFTKLPSARSFTKIYEHNPALALEQVYNAGYVGARELIDCNIDLNLSPILDLDYQRNTVIGDRSFGNNPDIVTTIAKQFISGMHAAGMQAIGKHYPGHGFCQEDSHDEMAIDNREFSEIQNKDLKPFGNLIEDLQGIMPAHVLYPKVDNNLAGFSKKWLQDILRLQLNFKGAIISDCLSMQSAVESGSLMQRAEYALQAGCDLIIVSQQSRAVLWKFLSELTIQADENQLARISKLQANFTKPIQEVALAEISEV